ncbi:MAG: hypothetical protein ABIU76_09955 [Gemmatimonadaceae bacterium]
MTPTLLQACLVAALIAPSALAQKKVDKSSPVDHKNAAILVLVHDIKDATAYAEITRYHAGHQRNIILLPARSVSPGTIADALGVVVAVRERDHLPVRSGGKEYAGDDKHLSQRFSLHNATDFKARPQHVRLAAESLYSQLMAAPRISIADMPPNPAIVVRLTPAKGSS